MLQRHSDPDETNDGWGVLRETVATETEAIFYHVTVVIILPHSAQQFGASLRIWRDYLTERVQGHRCLALSRRLHTKGQSPRFVWQSAAVGR